MSQIAGVLLAAGASTRFGQPKQLLDWGGVPLVTHMADTALAAGLDPMVAVLGHAAEEVRAALANTQVQPVMNWRWREGLSTSVQIGLAMLPPDSTGVVLLQCDQPLVTPNLLQRLISRFEETAAPIVYPAHGGQRATPVLFARSLFPELAAVTGDQGGRVVIACHAEEAATVEVEDPDVLMDIDTPEEYRQLVERIPGSSAHEKPRSEATLARIRHAIVDMDGVLWRGDQPLPGLQEFFALLRKRGVRFVLATNNASKRPQQYAEKLARFGVQVPLERILTSAQATAAYLAARAPERTTVYVVGKEGLREALVERGFVLGQDGAHYVVVGWDPDLTWQALARATLLIRGGAQFIGTNPDVTFPREEGLVPGNGAQLAALQAATGIAPLVIGKPERWLYEEAMRRMGASPETTCIIGDRLDTDVAGGIRLGLFSILALSGITTETDVVTSAVKPGLVCTGIEELVQMWKNEAVE
jgi:4-nitrophenyl phosphatase